MRIQLLRHCNKLQTLWRRGHSSSYLIKTGLLNVDSDTSRNGSLETMSCSTNRESDYVSEVRQVKTLILGNRHSNKSQGQRTRRSRERQRDEEAGEECAGEAVVVDVRETAQHARRGTKCEHQLK